MLSVSDFLMYQTCGCNATVDRHEAVDLDGATDKLETIQDEFKSVSICNLATLTKLTSIAIQTATIGYPLIARSGPFKKFRKSLSEFVSRLVTSANETEILYDDHFVETVQTWLASSSNSNLRSFRHTCTIIALNFVTGLAQVAVLVADDLAKATRQRDNEKGKSRKDTARLKDLERRVKTVHKRKLMIENNLKLLFDTYVSR
jgi:cohesin complex subunit SA-1/2